jgi:hypothetical protein
VGLSEGAGVVTAGDTNTAPAYDPPLFKTEAEWYAWQNDPATRAVSDKDFWETYALHFGPGKWGILVELEVEAHTDKEAQLKMDAQLRRSRIFSGRRTGLRYQRGLGDFKSPVEGKL